MADPDWLAPTVLTNPERIDVASGAAALQVTGLASSPASDLEAGHGQAASRQIAQRQSAVSHGGHRLAVGGQAGGRQRLSFRAVNRRNAPGYEPGLQRHHILPCQILTRSCFHPLLDALGRERLHFDDFRHNGLLLPANDAAAVRIGLPLHRGPHRDYNAMVIERVGQIEGTWSSTRPYAPEVALAEALEGLRQLQHSLRRQLLDQQHRLTLNRRDPFRSEVDFTELDAMADLLWPTTAPAET